MFISQLRKMLIKASDYEHSSLFAPSPGGFEKFLAFFMLN